MGDIHLCRDTHLDRKVVFKVLKEGQENRRLLDEQLSLLKIRSKHVVQLYDVVHSTDNFGRPQTSLVLEYIEGNDLDFGAFSQYLDWLKAIWQIACGLVEIHDENIIHRDIKPSNIRVDQEGVIKILDFGLARSEGSAAVTRSIIGSRWFMAPELWGRGDISFDKMIDVYAFGVTALALIKGKALPQKLFNGDMPPSAIAEGEIQEWFGDLVVPDIRQIIERCLSYSPQDRPTMREVEIVLRRHLLRNRHRALIVLGSTTHEINAEVSYATVGSNTRGSIGIRYDGLKFVIDKIVGTIAINNTPAVLHSELPACCVIAFGVEARSFVTFDVSNPQVMP